MGEPVSEPRDAEETDADPATAKRLPAGRKVELAAYVSEVGEVTVARLASHFRVSLDTIRRDLDQLDAEGLVIRTHGGAVSLAAGNRPDTELEVRLHVQADAKETIGMLAASLVEDGSVIMLNGGTTTLAVARHLRKHRNLTIATNNLRIPAEISPAVLRDMYMFGGAVRTLSQTTTGPVSLRLMPGTNDIELQADLAFIGVGAVSAEGGYSTSNLSDAAMMEAMMERATRVAVLADSAKFDRRLFAQVGALSSADYFISEKRPPKDLLTALRRSKVEVIVPEDGR
ncbi:DeoR/GlpR family DNA-binding transcription regulator [Leifsonia shinshuensis]|uniref:DeoR family fructose operon transcriptional repressor n=1 Tax=Leifsonia shinshuensis TaxID=150026 RepID=A0A853D037_9MICO|nr:DeoR/GlpR family DNA-binding transcription regulator [Leifsonia shinshuensis]NYJ25483.1 DeoR family fructose operon transcriptional repressor [Leifsonia shinshuensis]